MINLANGEQAGLWGTVLAVFDRVVGRHLELYALVVAAITIVGIAVIH